ncbi:MAG: flagellar basal body rod protein FlgB [Mariprofundus sp.]
MDMLGHGFEQLKSAMIAREKLQGALSSNIANADTPNFRADKRTFADFMAVQQLGKNTGKAVTTNPMHIADTGAMNLSAGIISHKPTASMDGNNVDVQKEMALMSENQLMHEMTMRLLKGKLSGLANTIKEGSR